MRHLRFAFSFTFVLLAGCGTATPTPPRFEPHAHPSNVAFLTTQEALHAALERVCRPYLAVNPTEAHAEALSTAAGFRATSPREALEGVGEDYVANIALASGARVTLDFNLDMGERDCGIAVMGAPQAFDSYIETLLASGWKPVGPPVPGDGEHTEWMWAPDGTVTLVATRPNDISLVPPHRVLGFYLTKGAQPIPPECGPTQAPPCRTTH